MTHELIYVFGLIRNENYIYIKFQQIEKSKKKFRCEKTRFCARFCKNYKHFVNIFKFFKVFKFTIYCLKVLKLNHLFNILALSFKSRVVVFIWGKNATTTESDDKTEKICRWKRDNSLSKPFRNVN